MREVHERDGDDADTGPDSRPDAGAGNGDDPRRPGIAIVPDSATRAALALAVPPARRGTPIACPVRATTSPARRPGGIQGPGAMITMGRTRVPGSWPGGRRGEPTFL